MPLDGLCLHALRQELAGRLVNARVQKIFQPWPDAVILHLRKGSETERLLVCASPQHPSAHLTDLDPDNPLQAPLFAMVLRKHLDPARLLRVEQPGLDRILHFVFETFEEQGRRAERTLVAELVGRNGNIVLLDPETGRVIDALRRGSAGGRTLLPGSLYEPPVPPSDKRNPFTETEEEFLRFLRLAPGPEPVARLLTSRYDGFGPFAAAEVLYRAGVAPDITRERLTPEAADALWRAFSGLVGRIAAGDIEPALFQGPQGPDFWVLPPAAEGLDPVQRPASLSRAVDAVFAVRQQSTHLARRKNELLRLLRRLHARAERKLAERRREAEAAAQGDHFRHWADLLAANLYRVPAGASSVVVPDYTRDDEPVTIPLDPALSPAQNVQALYKRYQRARRAAHELARLLEEARMEAEYLAQVIASVELAESDADLDEIGIELMQQGLLPKEAAPRPKKRPDAAAQPLRFVSSDGHVIWVGRNNRQNDRLTLHMARPDDLWFHAKEIPGSHVILRVDGEPTPTAVHEAALLAAYYSKARDSANVPVDYVPRRHVRKPAGAPPGFVIYDHHKTLYVTPDPDAVRRLAAASAGAEA